jgi:hypothetical protein
MLREFRGIVVAEHFRNYFPGASTPNLKQA